MEDLYQTKRVLTKDLENLNFRLKEIREARDNKVLRILNEIGASVSCLSQEEIAIFVEEIIVYTDHIEILTKTGNKKIVVIDKLK